MMIIEIIIIIFISQYHLAGQVCELRKILKEFESKSDIYLN